MYEKLTISHFRAFGHLEVAPLHRINLIAGGNNVGKTSILEAVWLALQDNPFTSPDSFTSRAQALFRRSAIDYSPHTQSPPDDTDNFWKWLFFQKDTSQSISVGLLSATAPEANRTLTLRFNGAKLEATAGNVHSVFGQHMSVGRSPLPPPLVCTTLATFLPSPVVDAERVNTVSVLNRDDELVAYLRVIDPKISKLKYLKLPGHQHPYVYVDVGFGKGKELIPATQLGQGTARMLGLFASLMTEGTQILLIDEFENGLQHDALVPVWSALGKFAREHDVQIFATTHSYECIAAAHEAFSEHTEDFAVIKLRPDPATGIAAFVLGHEAVGAALNTELEIR
jgi:hypothetical protein